MPSWWRWLFYITMVFSLVYLALYPGLGNYAGSVRLEHARRSTKRR